MARISAYHRPSTLAEALDLLHRPALRTVVLAGGTSVVPAKVDQPTEVVDLQALGLAGIGAADHGRVVIGATTSFQEMADAPGLPTVLREAARREEPSTLRTLATVGGSVVERGPESEFLATLLAFDAAVAFTNLSGTQTRSLDDTLADPSVLHGAIVISIVISIGGAATVARTGRTPQDSPIVSVVARRRPDGSTVVAASGVAVVPTVVTDASALEPPSDFRGSSEYRRHLAVQLVGRATLSLGVLS